MSKVSLMALRKGALKRTIWLSFAPPKGVPKRMQIIERR